MNFEKPKKKSEFELLFEEKGLKGFDKGEEFAKLLEPKERTRRDAQIHQECQAKIDLHGFTTQEALLEVEKFLDIARKSHFRKILIITGSGKHSSEGKAKLRPAIMVKLQELKTNKRIVDFKIAQAKDGGYGALYVYL